MSLCLTKYHATKTNPVLHHALLHEDVWGMEIYLHAFLTSALEHKSSAKVNNAWSDASIQPYVYMARCFLKQWIRFPGVTWLSRGRTSPLSCKEALGV